MFKKASMTNRFVHATLAVGFLAFGAIALAAGPASAAGIGDLAIDWKRQIEALVDVIGVLSLLAGLGFGFMSALKFSKYSDSNGQIELKQPLMYLAVSILLIALPVTLGVGVGSLFGNKGNAITSSGSNTGLGQITPK